MIMLGNSSRDTRMLDEKAVMAKYGMPPALLSDYFGLVGDAVDNVPGVPGIGPKTADATCARATEGSRRSTTDLEGVRRPGVQSGSEGESGRGLFSRPVGCTRVPLGWRWRTCASTRRRTDVRAALRRA